LYIIYLRFFEDFCDGETGTDSEQTQEEETFRAQGQMESDGTVSLWVFARIGQHDGNEDGVNGSVSCHFETQRETKHHRETEHSLEVNDDMPTMFGCGT